MNIFLHFPSRNEFGTTYFRNQDPGIRYEQRNPPLFMQMNLWNKKCWCGKKIVKPRRKYCCNDHADLWYWSINTRWESFRDHVLRRDDFTCQECGYQPKMITNQQYHYRDDSNLQADHIIAIVNGGMCFDLENVRTLCLDCHHKKTGNDIREKNVNKKAEKFHARANLHQ